MSATASERGRRGVVAARPTLSAEQRRVVESLCLDGHGVAVVAGRAGTGKTFALGAAREAWQAAGLPVLGVAVARRAAGELWEGAGISSTSVAALLGDLAKGERAAGAVRAGGRRGRDGPDAGARRAARSRRAGVGEARARRRRSAAAGDRGRRRVPRADSARAGGRARRERPAGERVGARGARSPPRRTVARRRSGCTASTARWSSSRPAPEVRERLVARVARGARDGDCVMIAQRRADVADLNARARERLRARGAWPRGARAGRRRVRGRRPGRRQAQRPAARRDERRARGGGGGRSRRGLADAWTAATAGRARSRVPVERRRGTASRRCCTATR